MADFSWKDLDSEDLVQETVSVRAVAVYRNEAGAVVIRQQADEMDETEPVVVVEPVALPRLIARLQALKAEIDNGE